MKVKDRMTPNPVVAYSKTTHREAMNLLKEHGIGHLPVVDNQGRVCGIVSEVDLLSTGPSRVTSLSIYEIYTLLDELTLEQIMVKPVLAVEEACGLSHAASFMIENGVGSLLVIRDQALVGIITDTDIFKTFVEVLGGSQPGSRVEMQLADEKGMLAEAALAFAEAGSYIYSLTTFQDKSGKYTRISVKETGASQESLQAAIDAHKGVTMMEFRSTEDDVLLKLG